MDLFIQYGLVAAQEALEPVRLGRRHDRGRSRPRTATIIGTGVGGSPVMAEAVETIIEKGPRRLVAVHRAAPSSPTSRPAGSPSRYGFKGPIGAPVTACAASGQADRRRHAADPHRRGRCARSSAGPKARSTRFRSAASARRARWPPRSTTIREGASRPFDRKRDGFVLAEGAAVLVIERLSHAKARGADAARDTLRLRHVGRCLSPDGRRTERRGRAGRRCANALKMAGLSPGEIDYINAHSTSTQVGDAAELAGIGAVFANRGKDLAISSTKSATGHLMGAAGAIEAVFSILAHPQRHRAADAQPRGSGCGRAVRPGAEGGARKRPCATPCRTPSASAG